MTAPSSFYKKRISVSGSLLLCQPSNQSRSEPQQQSLAAHNISADLSHKQLHAQLTQRLEQVLKERELQQKNPQEHMASENNAGNRADTSSNTGAATNVVKQINSHYNHTAISIAAQDHVSLCNTTSKNRYVFNKSWCPNSVAKLPAEGHAYQSRMPSNQKRDIYAFNLDVPELSEKKNTRSSEISGMEKGSQSLFSSSKKFPFKKPAGCNVKKHLFSDTDIDNMTEISLLNSANRKPKPKVAYYVRQPVETPNIHISSPKSAKTLLKPKRKRQRKVVEEKNKITKDDAGRKPTNRPKRTSVLTKSYRELSGSESESETKESPSAKKFIIKQTENSQRRQWKKKTTEKELFHNVKPKQKKKIAGVQRFTKEQEHVLDTKITSFCPYTLPNVIKSEEKSTTILKPAPVYPKPKNLIVKQPLKSQAIKQEKKIDDIIEQEEKENKQPVKPTTCSVTSDKVIQEKEASEVLSSQQSKNRKILHSPVSPQESWASINTSFCLSPNSIEKTRSAENNMSLTRAPLTPIQSLCISPVGAMSPPLELPSHLRGIQASSLYKTSGGWDIDKCLPHSSSFVTPVAQRQNARENAELSLEQQFLHPLTASTGREKCPSVLNTPDQEEDYSGFLNSTNQRVLQTCFDKNAMISLVTQSQSSHTSISNISVICTELEKTPASVHGNRVKKAVSGPATGRTWHSSCNSLSLSEQHDNEDKDKITKAGPGEFSVRMKPRKLFKPNVKQQSKKKGSKHSILVDSSSEEGEKEKESVVSSCWEACLDADMDLVQSEVSTTQEMNYVCRQFTSELDRKFKNRSSRMDLFTRNTLKACKQHVSTITLKVQESRSQRLEAVKRVLMDELKNLEQDDTSLQGMEAELTAYWKKQSMAFHTYQKRGTKRLNHLRSAVVTNFCRNLDFEKQIFFSQMQLMKKDLKSIQDHLFRQMHGEELQSVRRGLQTLFLSDIPMFLQ